MIKITVHAGYSSDPDDSRIGSCADWSEYGPKEALRLIGLEYGTADYFPTRQVVIVLEPITNEGNLSEVKARLGKIMTDAETALGELS